MAVKEEFTVECIYEPRGYSGLEGYQFGEKYKAQLCSVEGRHYYRVYPSDDGYYETCGKISFNKFFKRI